MDRTWLKSPWMDPNDDLSSAYNLKLEKKIFILEKNISTKYDKYVFNALFKGYH